MKAMPIARLRERVLWVMTGGIEPLTAGPVDDGLGCHVCGGEWRRGWVPDEDRSVGISRDCHEGVANSDECVADLLLGCSRGVVFNAGVGLELFKIPRLVFTRTGEWNYFRVELSLRP